MKYLLAFFLLAASPALACNSYENCLEESSRYAIEDNISSKKLESIASNFKVTNASEALLYDCRNISYRLLDRKFVSECILSAIAYKLDEISKKLDSGLKVPIHMCPVCGETDIRGGFAKDSDYDNREAPK